MFILFIQRESRVVSASDLQALDDAAMPEVFIDDFVEVIFVPVGIPGALGIYHDNRPLLAAPQATGGIDANAVSASGKIVFLDLALYIITCFLRTVVVAAVTAVLALIGAEENMLVEKT